LAKSLDGALQAAWAIAEVLTPANKPLDIQVTATGVGLDVDVRGSGALSASLTAALARVAAAHNLDVLIMAGALTPTEVMTAWDAGVDFVKIFPCSNLGGPSYIKALKGPLPHVPLVPTGGVNLDTAADYIRAGAAALGVGGELVLKHAFQERKPELISNLAMRYAELVKEARTAMAAKSERTAEAH